MSELSSPSTQHNLPTTLLEANYSHTNFTPLRRQRARATQAPPVQVFANRVQVTPGWWAPLQTELSGSPSLGFVSPGGHSEGCVHAAGAAGAVEGLGKHNVH